MIGRFIQLVLADRQPAEVNLRTRFRLRVASRGLEFTARGIIHIGIEVSDAQREPASRIVGKRRTKLLKSRNRLVRVSLLKKNGSQRIVRIRIARIEAN